MIHKVWCSIEEVPYYFLRSYIKFQGHKGWKIDDLDLIWARLLGRSQLSNPSDLPCWSKVNIWNVDRTRTTAFIFDTQALIWNLKVKFMGVVIGQIITVSPVSNWFTAFLLASIWPTIHDIQLFEIWLWKNQCHIIIIVVVVIVYVIVIYYYYYHHYYIIITIIVIAVIIIIIIIIVLLFFCFCFFGWRLYIMADCI